MPILASACVESESESEFGDFRDSEIDFSDSVDGPFQGQGLAPQLGQMSVAIDVENTVQGQDFKSDEFACSVPKSMAGVQVGDQVRITRNGSNFALYTVAERRNGDNPNIVRMGQKGRQRLGTSNTFGAVMVKPVPAVGLTDVQAQAKDEFVERLSDNGNNDGLVVIAPHGGMIERKTCDQAAMVAAALSCSSWVCKGWKAGGGCSTRWHITATKISPRSFPGLSLIANRGFAYSVAFHGMAADGILIGGAAPQDLKQMLKTELKDVLNNSVDVKVASPNDNNSGTSAKNVVNWLTAVASVGSSSSSRRACVTIIGRKSRRPSSICIPS